MSKDGCVLESNYREKAIINLFYRHRIKEIDEMIDKWKRSDAWRGLDLEECVKHFGEIKSVIWKGIGG